MTHFIIMRRDGDNFATRGPLAKPLSLEDAKAEALSLKTQYPHQDFVLFGEVGAVNLNSDVFITLAAPDLSRPVLRLPSLASVKGVSRNV